MPQFDSSVAVSTQVPPQSVRPIAQPQRPAVHTWPVGQARPQAPQLAALLMVLTQVRPQSVDPIGQRHAPIWQVVPIAHAVPQAPQLALSVMVLTQRGIAVVPQLVCPAMHALVAVQVPRTHVCIAVQVRPHMPQLASSLVRSAQRSIAEGSQSV
jgi:hypothetical protein